MNRIRCPKCASLRISGDQVRFKCKACGFIHDSKIRVVLKPVKEISKNGLVFNKNLDVLVVKRRGNFENPLKNTFEKSKYKTVVYK